MIDTPAAAALRLVERGMDPEEACARFAIPLVELQQACGDRADGHWWEIYDRGDICGPSYEVWRACAVCGAPDEREGEAWEPW